MTNAHVIDGLGSIEVDVWNTDEWDEFTLPGTVLGKDDAWDVAVLHVCCDSRLDGLEMSFGMGGSMGDHVTILGHPYGRGIYATATAGIISANAVLGDVRVYLTDAPANPGNSGGPLLNSGGEVIGIVTSKRVGLSIEGQAHAIQIRGIRDIVIELCNGRCEIP